MELLLNPGLPRHNLQTQHRKWLVFRFFFFFYNTNKNVWFLRELAISFNVFGTNDNRLWDPLYVLYLGFFTTYFYLVDYMTTKRLDNMTVRYGIRRHVIFHLKDFIFHHLRFFLVNTNTFVNFIAWGSWCSIFEDMRIWSIQISICLSDCNGIWTHYHLVFKLTLKHLAKLAWTI